MRHCAIRAPSDAELPLGITLFPTANNEDTFTAENNVTLPAMSSCRHERPLIFVAVCHTPPIGLGGPQKPVSSWMRAFFIGEKHSCAYEAKTVRQKNGPGSAGPKQTIQLED